MNLTQKGFILMTNCGRFLSERSGIYLFTTDPFEAEFIATVEGVNIAITKSLEMWGESLIAIPTERSIKLL